MSELTVGTISGLAANNYVVDVAEGSQITQPGMVLQVVHAISETTTTTTSTSAVDTDLTATITPSSDSSKIAIFVSGTGTTSGTNSYGSRFRVYRGGSSGTALNSLVTMFTGDNTSTADAPVSNVFLDSPSTTSPVTYTLCIYSSNVANTAYFGRAGQGSIMLMEIAQ